MSTNSIIIEPKDNLNKVAEILRTVFESNSNHLLSAIETFTEKEVIDYKIKDEQKNDDTSMMMTECMLSDDFSIIVGSPPPDILQKSSSSESGFESSADKPDILLNVSDEALTVPALLTIEKDESNSITPVDIVGNFEQEVQREIGLLVTRYKSTKKTNELSHEKMMTKVLDAKLSHADEDICKIGTFIRTSNDTQPDNTRANSTVRRDGKIPMAIVKPNYQRASFDERQLPAIAYENLENAWYDKPKSDSGSTPNKKIKPKRTHKQVLG